MPLPDFCVVIAYPVKDISIPILSPKTNYDRSYFNFYETGYQELNYSFSLATTERTVLQYMIGECKTRNNRFWEHGH